MNPKINPTVTFHSANATPPFSAATSGCDGKSLAPGDSCELMARFKPTQTGEAVGKLTATSAASFAESASNLSRGATVGASREHQCEIIREDFGGSIPQQMRHASHRAYDRSGSRPSSSISNYLCGPRPKGHMRNAPGVTGCVPPDFPPLAGSGANDRRSGAVPRLDEISARVLMAPAGEGGRERQRKRTLWQRRKNSW